MSSSPGTASPPESPPPGVGPSSPSAVTPEMEERLVRRIHKRMGGQSRLKGISDPAIVRHIVLSALAEDQSTKADADRVLRNALSVLERRAVRTVTNRGAAVRSRQRQRVHLSELRAALVRKDHQLNALRKAFGAVQAVLSELDGADLDLSAVAKPAPATPVIKDTPAPTPTASTPTHPAFPMLDLPSVQDFASSPVTPSQTTTIVTPIEAELNASAADPNNTNTVKTASKVPPQSPPLLQLAAPVHMPSLSAATQTQSATATHPFPVSECTTPATSTLAMDDPVADILGAFHDDLYWKC